MTEANILAGHALRLRLGIADPDRGPAAYCRAFEAAQAAGHPLSAVHLLRAELALLNEAGAPEGSRLLPALTARDARAFSLFQILLTGGQPHLAEAFHTVKLDEAFETLLPVAVSVAASRPALARIVFNLWILAASREPSFPSVAARVMLAALGAMDPGRAVADLGAEPPVPVAPALISSEGGSDSAAGEKGASA